MSQRNQFGTTLYRNQAEMLEAIAESWLENYSTHDSLYNEARDCIAIWGLGVFEESWGGSHMNLNDYTVTDLADAMLGVAKRVDESSET